jgi:MFS family permease
MVGYYLSFAYFALVLGALFAGWLSDQFQHRKILFIVSSVGIIPATWMLNRTTDIWSLAMITAIIWFLGGASLTLLNILAGLFATKTDRGKVFGILAMADASGALIGGLAVGRIVGQWGYSKFFMVLTLFSMLSPLIAVFLEDKVVARTHPVQSANSKERQGLGRSFLFLFLASTIAGTILVVGRLGTSLVMNEHGFIVAAIASTGVISGAAVLPLSALLGWLSDRIGRNRLLVLCYLSITAGMVILTISSSLWQFWFVAALLSVGNIGKGVGSALVTDLVPHKSVGKAMSLFSATIWIGGIIGFAGTGYTIQHVGMSFTFILGATLSLIAVILLIPVRQTVRGATRVPSGLFLFSRKLHNWLFFSKKSDLSQCLQGCC